MALSRCVPALSTEHERTAVVNVSEMAQRALSLIPAPSRWSHQEWVTFSGRICLGTALIRAARVTWVRYGDDCLRAVPQPVLDRTADIIREQFPRWRICPGRCGAGGRPATAQECTCPAYMLIPEFNDYWRTRYVHVRLVLEKLRADETAE
jgi:hypothetical protein